MIITYNTKTGKVTVTLSETEARQFISSQEAVSKVREAVHGALQGMRAT